MKLNQNISILQNIDKKRYSLKVLKIHKLIILSKYIPYLLKFKYLVKK